MLIRIQNYTVEDIENSIKFLLDRAAHSQEVRELAIGITHDKEDKIAGIYDFIKTHVSYVPDPVSNGDIELFVSPIKLVKDYNEGKPVAEDCDGQAILVTSLCRAIGIRSNVIIIDSVGNGLDHAYSQAYSDKLQNWVDIDPTSDYPLGWELTYKEAIVIE